MKKFWKNLGSFIFVILALGAIFMLVTLILSNVHGQSLVAEWESWFGIAKEAVDSSNLIA